MIILYQIITRLLWPVSYLHLLYRRLRGKEDKFRFNERFGRATIERPQGQLIWIHAASVGESLSVMPLLTLIRQNNPNLTMLITTGTVHSAEIIKNKLTTCMIHQYIPIDNLKCVRRFLNHWQPNLVIWMESELWPNLVFETAKLSKIILLNARMSKTSYERWRKLPSFASILLQQFAMILPQSKNDLQKFQTLGANNIAYIGNIKYSSPPLALDKIKLYELQSMISHRRCWIAASTHEGEEEKFAEIHNKLKNLYPDILTIIIPRHPKRVKTIKDLLVSKKIVCAIRSLQGGISNNTDIYLADTMGELGLFYYLTSIAVIGGSFVPHGGHNPIEAAHFDCAIITGPYIANFYEICQDFKENKALLSVNDEQELYDALITLFEDKNKIKSLAENAKKFVDNIGNILEDSFDKIRPFLPGANDETYLS